MDGDRSNNKRENLEIVCANCHLIRHLKKSQDGNWVRDYKRLTPREKIAEITALGANGKGSKIAGSDFVEGSNPSGSTSKRIPNGSRVPVNKGFDSLDR